MSWIRSDRVDHQRSRYSRESASPNGSWTSWRTSSKPRLSPTRVSHEPIHRNPSPRLELNESSAIELSATDEPQMTPEAQGEIAAESIGEGIKNPVEDVVILKPSFDMVHRYGGSKHGRGSYRGGYPDRSPSWVSQYFNRVEKTKSSHPVASRFPVPGSSRHHHEPPISSSSLGEYGIPKTKADLFESSASRRMLEWERFKVQRGDDPLQFIETLSDVDEKETWLQILDLVGSGPDVNTERVSPIPAQQPPIIEPPSRRTLLGAPPMKRRRSPILEAPSFFRHELPSVAPKILRTRDYEEQERMMRPPPTNGPYDPSYGIANRREEPTNGSFYQGSHRSEAAPEPNLPTQMELLERNRELEAQLRIYQALHLEKESRNNGPDLPRSYGAGAGPLLPPPSNHYPPYPPPRY